MRAGSLLHIRAHCEIVGVDVCNATPLGTRKGGGENTGRESSGGVASCVHGTGLSNLAFERRSAPWATCSTPPSRMTSRHIVCVWLHAPPPSPGSGTLCRRGLLRRPMLKPGPFFDVPCPSGNSAPVRVRPRAPRPPARYAHARAEGARTSARRSPARCRPRARAGARLPATRCINSEGPLLATLA